MSDPSSYDTFESEEESGAWLMSSDSSFDEDDDLSDELTLLNGDENSDEDSLLDDDFIKLSQRLKEKYNLQEATVELERCDKIWDTMQLLKSIQRNYESDDTAEDDDDDEGDEVASSRSDCCVPGTTNSSVPYIKYQPVQGNGNNALPNFYLAVKSQRKVYHCVTCGKQYNEKRSLRLHSEKEHGIVLPPERHKTRTVGEPRNLRPKTPSDLVSRVARNGRADEKISQNSSSRERDNSRSRLSNSSIDTNEPFKGRTKSTGSKEVDQLLGIANVCPLCDSIYPDGKSLSRHSIRFHGVTVADAKKQITAKQEKNSVGRPRKENSAKSESSTSRRGARSTRTSRGAASIAEWVDGAAKNTDARKDIAQKMNWRLRDTKVEGIHFRRTFRIINGVKYRRMYTCTSCGKVFFERKSLRNHTEKIHGIVIPQTKKGPMDHQTKNNGIFKCELVKVDDLMAVQALRKDAQQVEKYSKPTERRRGIDRPRRACASRTSYTECSKEEEEVVQKSLSGVPASPVKSSPNQPTNCFLCKKSFVDIRRHLVDYHRINSPESVLPLAAKTEPEIEENDVVSAKNLDTRARPTEEKKQETEKKPSRNVEDFPNFEVVKVNGTQRYQCITCLFQYKNLHSILRHLKKHTVGGVVRPHEAYTGRHAKRKEQYKQSLKDPIADPLALTDASDASKPNSTCSEDVDYRSVKRKRTISTSDECSSPIPESDAKRRKIEDFVDDGDALNGAESRRKSAQDNAERESVVELSETDRSSVEEAKSPNHRDTRDSSDRDSGIGISITIKKRNDSYEVVEKDSGGDDEKSLKDYENSKDDNLHRCSDSSSDGATADYVSYDDDSRRRENVNSNDCSKDANVLGSVRSDGGNDVENERKTEDRRASNDADNNFHWKDVCCDVEACTYMPGNVPSLKVLCRGALTTEEFLMSKSNDLTLSHQCPVCCRFYPTERDVTVHMLEHKVSRTNFRTARLHVIPSSALRRYGRKPV